MRILFLTHAFNSLAQRLFVELRAAGHEISIEYDINDDVTTEAVALFRPDVVVAPFLRRAIPEAVWRRCRCLVVHPGVIGDRGPAALDWAILNGVENWGVTVIEANAAMDAGPVWGAAGFAMRDAPKSSLYREEVTEAAVAAIDQALARIASNQGPLRPANLDDHGHSTSRPWMTQADRVVDWKHDKTQTIMRKLQASDGAPGVHDEIAGASYLLFGGHEEETLNAMRQAAPGALIAQRHGAVCRATVDGAVWITHAKSAEVAGGIKLPAATVLGRHARSLPMSDIAPDAFASGATWRDIVYTEHDGVGWLEFSFYNGAMGPAQCERLRQALVHAKGRATRVIVLAGGADFWSNGIDLNEIEASEHPAEASVRNIEAMDDLVREIITTERQLTIATLRGNAGAGGVFLALAADHVWARSGIVLNPHYRSMGNLYGSEYWTYLLPRRVSQAVDRRAIVENRLPIGAPEAAGMGLIDAHFGASVATFEVEVAKNARKLARRDDFMQLISGKRAARARDEALKPLAAYRDEELREMRLNFFGFDPSYHVARYNFVTKVPRSRTPLHLAVHRRRANAQPH